MNDLPIAFMHVVFVAVHIDERVGRPTKVRLHRCSKSQAGHGRRTYHGDLD